VGQVFAIVGCLGFQEAQHADEYLLAEISAVIASQRFIVDGKMAEKNHQLDKDSTDIRRRSHQNVLA